MSLCAPVVWAVSAIVEGDFPGLAGLAISPIAPEPWRLTSLLFGRHEYALLFVATSTGDRPVLGQALTYGVDGRGQFVPSPPGRENSAGGRPLMNHTGRQHQGRQHQGVPGTRSGMNRRGWRGLHDRHPFSPGAGVYRIGRSRPARPMRIFGNTTTTRQSLRVLARKPEKCDIPLRHSPGSAVSGPEAPFANPCPGQRAVARLLAARGACMLISAGRGGVVQRFSSGVI
jgi:hypothetical protein